MAKNPVLERHGFRSMLGAATACAVQSVRIQAWLMALCTRAVSRNRPASRGETVRIVAGEGDAMTLIKTLCGSALCFRIFVDKQEGSEFALYPILFYFFS